MTSLTFVCPFGGARHRKSCRSDEEVQSTYARRTNSTFENDLRSIGIPLLPAGRYHSMISPPNLTSLWQWADPDPTKDWTGQGRENALCWLV
jgi:hypothetical protein